MVNEYEKEADILKGQEMAEKQLEKEDKGCDWSNPEEVKLHLAEVHSKEREKRLDRIVPNRICPCCKRRIWLDKMWVVTTGGQAYCRSCYHCKINPCKDNITGSFITEVVIKYEINGWKLKALRGKGEIGAIAFADKMGWSRTYLYRVENNQIKTLTADVVERMLDVFDELGVVVMNSSKP